MYASFDPYNQSLSATFPSQSKTQLAGVIESAHTAFEQYWKDCSVTLRIGSLSRLPLLLKNQRAELAALITSEMGKPISQSLAEIDKCILLCEYYTEIAADVLHTRTNLFADKHFEVHYQPLGTIVGIMPWNFPFWQAFRFAIPTLIAGNTILLKPASSVPRCGLKIAELIAEAVGNEHVFNVILADLKDIEGILAHPWVSAVSLTGSTRAGTSVAGIAGKYLKKSVLELGGSDPFIVWKDADLDQAATAAVKSRMQNNGQTCLAAKRWLVHEEIFDTFLDKVKSEIASLKVGDPMDPEVVISTLSSESIYKTVQEQIQRAINQGASYWTVPGKSQSKWQFLPGILSDINSSNEVAQEELFGPVAQLYAVKSERQMLEIANQTGFGLGASVWTADLHKAEEWASCLACGCVSVNQMLSSDPRVPFGGIKQSGFGRELGPEGLLEFVNVKAIQLPL